jgi:hypothetical protein
MANPVFPLLNPVPQWPLSLPAVGSSTDDVITWLMQFQQAYFTQAYTVAGVVNQLTQVGTTATMPVAGLAGRLYLTTDTVPPILWEDNGTIWIPLNMSGTVVLAAGSASVVATLPATQPDTDYTASVTPVAGAGSPATGSNRVLSLTKATTTLTITTESDPSPGNVTFDYILVR